MTVQCEVYIKEGSSNLNFLGAELFPGQLEALKFVYTIGRSLKEIFQHELPHGFAYTNGESITHADFLVVCLTYLTV